MKTQEVWLGNSKRHGRFWHIPNSSSSEYLFVDHFQTPPHLPHLGIVSEIFFRPSPARRVVIQSDMSLFQDDTHTRIEVVGLNYEDCFSSEIIALTRTVACMWSAIHADAVTQTDFRDGNPVDFPNTRSSLR